MKKLLILTLILLLMLSTLSLTAFAAEDPVYAYVTIADGEGKLVLAQGKVEVTDIDSDGKLTVNDALYAAHEAKYDGGATAGYASYTHPDYGLSLGKLWGNDSGSFGYCLNNVSAWSLADEVSDGDYVNAFVYTDLTNWSDTYCFFDVNTVSAETGKDITVTLSANGYDTDWNPIVVPVEGAAITVNGEKTEVNTDENGKATITIDTEGTYVISAVSDTLTLVPPVCTATASAAPVDDNGSPSTGDTSDIALAAVVMSVSLCGFITLGVLRKKSYDK